MDIKDIENKVIIIVSNQLVLNKEDITPNMDIVQDLGADSLDLVEIVMNLEKEFKIEIPDDNIPFESVTVGYIVNYINSRLE